MSTSVKNLTGLEVVFKRPAIALGFALIVFTIVANPFYNTLFVLLAIVLYGILYQNRRFIYSMGLGRFDFLAFLFYGSFILSAFVSWDYKVHDISELKKLSLYLLLTNSGYQSTVKNWLIDNGDMIFHWKAIVFAPAFAAILYFIFVECDRKTVKEADLQSLGLTDDDLYRHGSAINLLGIGAFVIASFLYGLPCMLVAVVFIMLCAALGLNALIWVSFIGSAVILLFNFAYFKYELFLSLPTQFTDLVEKNGLWNTVKLFMAFRGGNNIGQLYILLPYTLMTSILAVVYMFNRGKTQEILQRQAQEREVASTADFIDFGYETSTRKLVRLTHKELNTHMYINGASGSGKTVAMLNFVIEAAQKGIPMVYIDGKGATDLMVKMATICRDYGRTFKVFTLSPGAVANASAYDFLGSGTFTEKKNRIMQLFIQADVAGAAYYQDSLETFVNRVFMIIHSRGLNVDLFRFLSLITNINDLVAMAEQDIVFEDGSKINLKSYFEDIRDMKQEQSPRTRIITKLDPFIHSSYGHLFNVIGKDNVINIKQSILSREIILFLFDASAFSLDTERVAKMVISDLNATFAEFGKENQPIKTFCCFDEFKSYQTDAISTTIALHRSNGMHAIIGTQSLALIDRKIADGILTNCQTHLVMASADADAARFAEEFGKTIKIDVSTKIRSDTQQVSDLIARNTRDYRIDKQDIKDIRVGTGQGYLHRKAVGIKPAKIQVKQKI